MSDAAIPHGFGRWFIAVRADRAIVLPRRYYHETTLRACGVRYCCHGYATRAAAIQDAAYMTDRPVATLKRGVRLWTQETKPQEIGRIPSCAVYGCNNPALVETRRVTTKPVAFYYVCREHAYVHEGGE